MKAGLRRYRTMVSDSARWDAFPFRPDDVVISTPPKCGTTWMQMLCGLLVFDTPEFDRPLTEISPWVDAVTYEYDAALANLEAQQHRRFMKTHTPLDGLPMHQGVTYICVGRDPRDVAVSFANAQANVSPKAMTSAFNAGGVDPATVEPPPEDPHERFRRWASAELLNGPQAGFGATLANMMSHMQTFWDRREEPEVALFHYSDLLADLPSELRRLATVLSIDVSDRRIKELAAAATFDSMRARADELAPGIDNQIWSDNRAFFHSGTNRQWHDLLDADDIRRYEERLAELASPELAAWLHTGSLGLT